MWESFSSFILRQRVLIIFVLAALTAFFGYHSRSVKMSYEMAQMLPESDSTLQVFNQFKAQFGQDGSIMVIGVKDDQLYELKNFQEWYKLSKRLKEVEGIDKVVSMANVYGLEKDKVNKRLVPYPVIANEPQTQMFMSCPFTKGLSTARIKRRL